ncbi:hypothetical protein J8273_4383 [Carpediemonas membranifera]|uniref:Uncharacterized protein n=1 Tax=Carpediemonas membranifera TaxID=201153 RepID=A0A8J6B206_9EUKA|nr:hypothetical protein J8273_4383 [Carpediemonas membranifera]|eukprot:KAG9394023.1 hypothetical protein J8273_4383 [Carpediemonas membranifera]
MTMLSFPIRRRVCHRKELVRPCVPDALKGKKRKRHRVIIDLNLHLNAADLYICHDWVIVHHVNSVLGRVATNHEITGAKGKLKVMLPNLKFRGNSTDFSRVYTDEVVDIHRMWGYNPEAACITTDRMLLSKNKPLADTDTNFIQFQSRIVIRQLRRVQ